LVIINNNPLFAGDTTGLDRRVCLVKFDKALANADSSVEAAMIEELDALISIALMMDAESVKALIKEKVGTSTKVDKWLNKVENCAVAHFMEECIAPTGLSHKEQVAGNEYALFEQFIEFCSQHKVPFMKSNTFSRRFHEHLDFLEWKYEKKKARINGSQHPVPVTCGIAIAGLYDWCDSTTISERLAGTVADVEGGVADTCADICADKKPLQNQGCADVADVFGVPPLEEENNVAQQIPPIEEATPSKISATSAQVPADKGYTSAHTSAHTSATPKQTPATPTSGELIVGSKVGKLGDDGRKLHGWIGYIRKLRGSKAQVWWEGDYDRKKSGVVVKNSDGTSREKLTHESIEFLVPIK
jgi:putative DNA primase/helicase